jgi:hypothetical protein
VGNTAAAASSGVTHTKMMTLMANSYSLQIIIQITHYSVDLPDIQQKLRHNTSMH